MIAWDFLLIYEFECNLRFTLSLIIDHLGARYQNCVAGEYEVHTARTGALHIRSVILIYMKCYVLRERS